MTKEEFIKQISDKKIHIANIYVINNEVINKVENEIHQLSHIEEWVKNDLIENISKFRIQLYELVHNTDKPLKDRLDNVQLLIKAFPNSAFKGNTIYQLVEFEKAANPNPITRHNIQTKYHFLVEVYGNSVIQELEELIIKENLEGSNMNEKYSLPYFDYIHCHETPKSEFQLIYNHYYNIEIGGTKQFGGENLFYRSALEEYNLGLIKPLKPNWDELRRVFISKMRTINKNEADKTKIFDCLEYHLKVFINKGGNKEKWLYNVEGYFEFNSSLSNEVKKWIEKQRTIELQTNASNKCSFEKPAKTFTPETEISKEWINKDYIELFKETEQELFEKGLINIQYKWQLNAKNTKNKLLDLTFLLFHYGYFKKQVNRVNKQEFHYRQFLSERYGLGSKGLTESYKKYKPTLEGAKIPFSWIKKL